jgi:hypothetical protein
MKALLMLILIILPHATANAAIVNDNCVSDQSSQIQSAIDARTGNITLPAGCIAISKPIYARDWISLQGAGRRLTTLKALANFEGPALVVIGTNLPSDDAADRDRVYDSMISDLYLDVAAAPAGTSCAYIAGAQAGSGMQRDLCAGVNGPTSDAIRISGNVNGAAFRELEIYPATAIRYGISIENAYCSCELSNITIGVTYSLTAGIRVLDTMFTASRIHCELAANCIRVDGNNSVVVISSIDGQTTGANPGYLLYVSGASKVVGQGLVKDSYAHNVRSLWGVNIDRSDPYIAQLLINN